MSEKSDYYSRSPSLTSKLSEEIEPRNVQRSQIYT